MAQENQYDVIIIGSGAGGGTLAYRLAPSGKRVLILERGGYLNREKENWGSKEIFVEGRYNNAENWLDGKGKEFQPGQHYFVGGNTKFYGAVLLRMRREDFGKLQHHGGVSPAWPLTYDDFEPYYTEAEQLYQRSILLHEQVLGARNRYLIPPLEGYAYFLLVTNHPEQAQVLIKRSNQIRDQHDLDTVTMAQIEDRDRSCGDET